VTWTVTDLDNFDEDESGNAALTFREADNAADRWQRRGRMASLCFDVRDPVDLGSVGRFRRFLIPDVKMLPGFTSLRIRMRYQLTHIEGVRIRWTVLNVPNFTPSAPVTLTAVTPFTWAITSQVLNVAQWVDTAMGDTLVLGLEVESLEATSEPVISLRLVGVSKWFIETAQAPSGPPSLGGITDVIECCSLGLHNAGKGLTLSGGDLPGGPFQTVSNGLSPADTPAGTDGGFYVWPKLTGLQTNAIPVTNNYFPIFNEEWNEVRLQKFARIQIAGIGIEQIQTVAFPVQGRSSRKPIIETGISTKGSLRPDYPGRAPNLRPIYAEGQRQIETHTTIHSIGPYSGTTGLQEPAATQFRRGTWPCYPSVSWQVPDITSKPLFGCRVGDDPEMRAQGGASTLVRRSYSVQVSMVWIGTFASRMQFVLEVKTYQAGSGTLLYQAPSMPFEVSPADTMITPDSGHPWEAMMVYSLAHPLSVDYGPPTSVNRNRRCNLTGLWDLVDWDVMRRHIVQPPPVTVFDPDPAAADPEVLVVEVRPSTTGTILLGDRLDLVNDVRCYCIGWSVTGKQGGGPLVTGA
jgi:hypothetical protein